MTLLRAVVMGLVQGLTEFLPISSTAHLRIVPELFGWEDPGIAYSAVIQLGTVAAVLIYFAKDMVHLGRAFLSGLWNREPWGTFESRMAWYVLLGTLPIGLFRLALGRLVDTSFRSLYVVAAALIGLAVALYLAERLASHRRTLPEMTLRDGMLIGVCQALALVPGASRSGTTITAALAIGFRREDAARYSFLLSIPVTALGGIYELGKLGDSPVPMSLGPVVVGTAVSFLSGLLAIAWLLRFLRSRSTLIFVVYRLLLGGALLGLLLGGVLRPQAGLAPQVAQVGGAR